MRREHIGMGTQIADPRNYDLRHINGSSVRSVQITDLQPCRIGNIVRYDLRSHQVAATIMLTAMLAQPAPEIRFRIRPRCVRAHAHNAGTLTTLRPCFAALHKEIDAAPWPSELS